MKRDLADSTEFLSDQTRQFYLDSMQVLHEAGVDFLVGGAYSLAHYAGIVRHTKDFDVFVRKSDMPRALGAFERADYRTELVFPHWLAKTFKPRSEDFVDIIFSSGNGLCDVDDTWFAHAVNGIALDQPARLVPAEENIWTKAFIQERERFDGADIAHLLLARGPELDWTRLKNHFRGHEQVLLAHLILFTYIYPTHRQQIPWNVVEELMQRVRDERPPEQKICRGTSISRAQYLPDIRDNGFIDSRLEPFGRMKAEDIAHWTAAIGTIK
ncbi:MAG: hypothetical protein QOF78_2753 [Phycisphaerales bacterium]|jgi:hypothetical protein|nr:hypothetical protein [Phycisphaerales bacterium]